MAGYISRDWLDEVLTTIDKKRLESVFCSVGGWMECHICESREVIADGVWLSQDEIDKAIRAMQ